MQTDRECEMIDMEDELDREQEEYEDQLRYEEQDHHDYSFYQDLNIQFNGNYEPAVDEAARIWKEFDRLSQTDQDEIYEKLMEHDKFYIYRELRRVMKGYEGRIIDLYDSSFDVCRLVYISRIISQPNNNEAVERLKEFELWAEEEMENAL